MGWPCVISIAMAHAFPFEWNRLVADEPVSMIDASLRASIVNLLRGLRERRGVSIIYITHDLATAYYVVRHGKVVESGEARAVLDDPQHPYSRLLKDSVLAPEVPPAGAAFHA
jgi:peptide/nickel transport system ATP-binding protein